MKAMSQWAAVLALAAGVARGGTLEPLDPPGPTMRSLQQLGDSLDALDAQLDGHSTSLDVCNNNVMLLVTMLADQSVAFSNQVQALTLANQQSVADLQQQLQQVSALLQERLGEVQQQVGLAGAPVPPPDMVTIPAGSFLMGACTNVGQEGWYFEGPQHTVTLGAFFLDKTEVTKGKWDMVCAWATNNGYGFSSGCGQGVGPYHPVQTVNWFDCVKWCNARSELEGLRAAYTVSGVVYRADSLVPDCDFRSPGYRLPTEAEWEKATRGGAANRRFPWGDTIQHARANYFAHASDTDYDTSPTTAYHPYTEGAVRTLPGGVYFAPNGYGLYDMSGNVREWCWDGYDSQYYEASPASDPTGAVSTWNRVMRDGNWDSDAKYCRCASRGGIGPDYRGNGLGFRAARTRP